MVPSGIEPLIPALLAPCLNQLGQGTNHIILCNICSESQRILVRCTDVRQQYRFDSREKHIRVDEKGKEFQERFEKKRFGKRNYKSGEEEQEVEKKNKRWRRRTRSGEEEQEVEKRNKKWRRTIR